MTRFLDAASPIAFAHRGFAPDGAENTMAAFRRAVELGYRYLETDVRVTSDGVALAFHDATLDRVTDRHGRIDRLPWSTVRAARIAGAEPIPLLADLLAAWPDVRVNLDVKAGRRRRAHGRTPIRRTGALHRVCVGSPSRAGDRGGAPRARARARARRSAPGEALGLRVARGPRRTTPRDAARRSRRASARLPLVDARYLAAARRLGRRCTSGPSTSGPRWCGCSTWASTAS